MPSPVNDEALAIDFGQAWGKVDTAMLLLSSHFDRTLLILHRGGVPIPYLKVHRVWAPGADEMVAASRDRATFCPYARATPSRPAAVWLLLSGLGGLVPATTPTRLSVRWRGLNEEPGPVPGFLFQ